MAIIKSDVDFYRGKYEKIKLKCEFQELFIERYKKQIDKLTEENNAYKVLLKNKLGG